MYLHLGDRVYHNSHGEWGTGAVVEEMTSVIEGGTCLVRILFEDGVQRTFNNDLDNEMCCAVFGIRRDSVLTREFSADPGSPAPPRRRVSGRRRYVSSD